MPRELGENVTDKNVTASVLAGFRLGIRFCAPAPALFDASGWSEAHLPDARRVASAQRPSRRVCCADGPLAKACETDGPLKPL